MEKISNIRVVRVRYYCDEPGCDGEVIVNKEEYSIMQSQLVHRSQNIIPHNCNVCGEKYKFEHNVYYPHKEYIDEKNN